LRGEGKIYEGAIYASAKYRSALPLVLASVPLVIASIALVLASIAVLISLMSVSVAWVIIFKLFDYRPPCGAFCVHVANSRFIVDRDYQTVLIPLNVENGEVTHRLRIPIYQPKQHLILGI
jgi:uncharacterized membrane protein YphA (DoxX/SURF4 family)